MFFLQLKNTVCVCVKFHFEGKELFSIFYVYFLILSFIKKILAHSLKRLTMSNSSHVFPFPVSVYHGQSVPFCFLPLYF